MRLKNIIYLRSQNNRNIAICEDKFTRHDKTVTFKLTNLTSYIAYRGSFSRVRAEDVQGLLAASGEGGVSENDPLNGIRVPVTRYIVTMCMQVQRIMPTTAVQCAHARDRVFGSLFVCRTCTPAVDSYLTKSSMTKELHL